MIATIHPNPVTTTPFAVLTKGYSTSMLRGMRVLLTVRLHILNRTHAMWWMKDVWQNNLNDINNELNTRLDKAA